MKISEGLLQILSDLVKINLDRMDSYEKLVIENAGLNYELLDIFINKAGECRKNADALLGIIQSYGQFCLPLYMPAGEILNAWNQNKYLSNGLVNTAMLLQCEWGEEAVLEAYKTALTSEMLTDFGSRNLIMDQKYALQSFKISLEKYNDLFSLHMRSESINRSIYLNQMAG